MLRKPPIALSPKKDFCTCFMMGKVEDKDHLLSRFHEESRWGHISAMPGATERGGAKAKALPCNKKF
ncbi:hypothetical protein J6590_071454 [Homalodisca vitripennis]|nr:hypothetical protein J6590_071454 [Homalodisca vitripennis]